MSCSDGHHWRHFRPARFSRLGRESSACGGDTLNGRDCMKTMLLIATAAAAGIGVASAQGQSTAPPARPLNPPPGLSDTAVAVSADGRFLTASHAVEGRREISVRCPDGATYPVTVGAKLPALDLAVLQVKNQATLK